MASIEWIPTARAIKVEREGLIKLKAFLVEARAMCDALNADGDVIAANLPASDPFHATLAEDKAGKDAIIAVSRHSYQKRVLAQIVKALAFQEELQRSKDAIVAANAAVVLEIERQTGVRESTPAGTVRVVNEAESQMLRLLDQLLNGVVDHMVELQSWAEEEGMM